MPNYSLLKHFAQNKHKNYDNVTFYIMYMLLSILNIY